MTTFVEESFANEERLPDYLERLEKQSRREKDESTRVEILQETCKDHVLANALKEYARLRGCIHARIAGTRDRLKHLPSYKEVINDDYSVSQGNVIATVTYRQTTASIRPITLMVTFARTKTVLGLSSPETNRFMPVVTSLHGPIQWAPDEKIEWARDEEHMTTEQLAEWVLVRLTDYYLDDKELMEDR